MYLQPNVLQLLIVKMFSIGTYLLPILLFRYTNIIFSYVSIFRLQLTFYILTRLKK